MSWISKLHATLLLFWNIMLIFVGICKKKTFKFSGTLCTIRRSPFLGYWSWRPKVQRGGGGHSPLYALLMTFTHEYIYLHRTLMVTSFCTTYVHCKYKCVSFRKCIHLVHRSTKKKPFKRSTNFYRRACLIILLFTIYID